MHVSRQRTIETNLVLRARTLAAIRAFFECQGYLEVETPIRIPAPAPEDNIEAQPSGSWYLQTSPELCMKRLLAAGYPRIFQIARCFRQQERGGRHLPEMTLLEWYTSHAGYGAMMVQCEALITSVAESLGLGTLLPYQGDTIDLTPPWPRLTVARAFERFGAIPMEDALAQDRFDEIMGLEIEPNLGRRKPTFLCDYPTACGALARRKPDSPDLVERFELYIGGLELCNAFGELTDPQEQRSRFETALARRRTIGTPSGPMPERFLEDLAHMPPAAGNALGVDRLVMLLADSSRIDDVVAFTPEEL
jgi:lysyl-tRNA synthetase class 2